MLMNSFHQRLMPRNVFPGYREVMIFQQVNLHQKQEIASSYSLFATNNQELANSFFSKDSMFRGTCGTVS